MAFDRLVVALVSFLILALLGACATQDTTADPELGQKASVGVIAGSPDHKLGQKAGVGVIAGSITYTGFPAGQMCTTVPCREVRVLGSKLVIELT